MSKKYYIVMADVIRSSEFDGEGGKLMSQFKELVSSVNELNKERILSPLTITLGDEFQGVMSDRESAVQILIDSEEARIRSELDFKLRYAIYYGEIDTEINKSRAHEMVGRGLTKTRKILEKMKSEKTRFSVGFDSDSRWERLIEDALTLYFGIVDKWKLNDYPLISAFIDGMDYKEASILLGRDRTSTLRKERSLRMDEYFACKRVLKELAMELQ